MLMSDPKTQDDMVALLLKEFLEDASERVQGMEAALSDRADAEEQRLLALSRDAHNLKGMGSSFGFPTITLIAHRLEDYLAGTRDLNDRRASDIQRFLDEFAAILAAGRDPGDEAASALVRALPDHPDTAEILVEVRDVEVLLVASSRSLGEIVARELRACGYRVTKAATPWGAFELAIRTKPDLVITSVVLDRVSGIDLAQAFASMGPTRDVPLAVLTSFDEARDELRGLPEAAKVVRIGPGLSEELADVLAGLAAG